MGSRFRPAFGLAPANVVDFELAPVTVFALMPVGRVSPRRRLLPHITLAREALVIGAPGRYTEADVGTPKPAEN